MKTVEERFLSYVEFIPEHSCWEWIGNTNGRGYGTLKVKGKLLKSHRISYALYKGSIEEKLHILHTCDNTRCVNPEHLVLGTHLDNMKDRDSKKRGKSNWGKHQSTKTHCPRGHLYDKSNTYKHRNKRYCRKCRNERIIEFRK